MIENRIISGLVVLSDAEWGCYPYLESIKSFLPVVDELVIAFNVYGRKDGSREKVEGIGSSKIRIIPSVFDIEKYGWVSYGIARTMGYQACKGDVILMFDADGVLHEKDIEPLKQEVKRFINEGQATGYWRKNRIYKPTIYWDQHKHSGIYSKEILGDRMDFFRPDGKGAPNFGRLTIPEQRSRKFNIILFGYEHLWDTREVLQFKVNRYGRMIDRQTGKPFKTPEEYFENYMRELVDRVAKTGKTMSINDHPAIMRDKIKSINETHFGYDFFGFK